MSIIQEALVKAQKKSIAEKAKAIENVTTESGAAETVTEKKPAPKTHTRSFFYGALLLAVLALFASRYLSPAPRNENINQASQPAEAVVTKTTFENNKVFEFPKQLVMIQDEFTLSGIMDLEDGPRAIINNATLSEGDNVGGAKVVKINNDSVVLKKRDAEIVLHLK